MKFNGALQALRDEARGTWEHYTHPGWKDVTREMAAMRTTNELIKWGQKNGFDEKDVRAVMEDLLAAIESARDRTSEITTHAGNNEETPKQSRLQQATPIQHGTRKRPQVRKTAITPQRKASPTARDMFQRAVGSRDGPSSSITRLVLLRLSMYGNPDGTRIFPGVRRIAEDCRLNTSTVVQHLKKAESQGWIQRERRRYEDGSYGSFQYTLLVPTTKRGTAEGV
jgi:hypothetical protein